ncbi:ubiquitin specific cysteine protease, OTU family, Otu2 [Schizosaccharomyces pombe]|uniref:Ubiquitin thioesterase otu2 n=1 Tax=Schizosaccharomyces pombe (strain 972 / ATCC 24843) TaxID=284812 RepID=OTU2_SCHPO
MEELLSKQREECKELQSKITNLRKQLKEGNKKQKRALQQKISQMEADLSQKHATERQKLDKGDEETNETQQEDLLNTLLQQMEDTKITTAEKSSVQSSLNTKENTPQQPKKSRNRQKERLERRKAEMKKMSEQAELESEKMADLKNEEKKKFSKILEEAGLVAVDIPADGNCLFASISHQLNYHHNVKLNSQALRNKSADYVLKHCEQFEGFLLDEESGEVLPVSDYCNEIRNNSKWGSDIEIQALANSLEVPVHVYNTEGPVLKFNPSTVKFEKPLCIAYYQHLFGLGAHYNSLLYRDN